LNVMHYTQLNQKVKPFYLYRSCNRCTATLSGSCCNYIIGTVARVGIRISWFCVWWPSFCGQKAFSIYRRTNGCETSAQVSCQKGCLSQSTAAAASHTHSPDLAPSDYHRYGQLKESSVDEDLPEMIQLRRRFVLSWQIELRGLVKRCTSGIEKEVIMWRNETLCICDRLLHTNQSVDSLYFLAHPSKSYCSIRDKKNRKARKD
jgi:hypothetical protein